MSDASILVPIVRPPSYAPAWAEKPPGLRVSRTLDLADLLADRKLHLVSASVALEPPLVADSFDITGVAVTFFVTDAPAAAGQTRWRVRFDLRFSDGSQDEIVAYQPIGAAPPAGLVAADVTAASLVIGGQAITVGGETINAN